MAALLRQPHPVFAGPLQRPARPALRRRPRPLPPPRRGDRLPAGLRRRLDANIRTGSRVTAVTADGPYYIARLDGGNELRARAVIAASGSFTRPHLPALPGLDLFTGTLLHAS